MRRGGVLPSLVLPGVVTVVLTAMVVSCAEPPSPPAAAADVPPAVLERMIVETGRRAADDREAAVALLEALHQARAGTLEPGSAARQRVVTAWMSDAIEGGRIEEAHRAWEVLSGEFGGAALFPTGVRAAAPAVAAGLLEAAADEARNRIEGVSPDPEAAGRALAVADAVRAEAADPEAWAEVERVRRWTSLRTLAEAEPRLPPHGGPRVVLWADDYALGEPVLLSVLARWAAEGKDAGLRVGVVPVRRGQVRHGMRRARATPEEEEASLSARLDARAVLREPVSTSSAEARERLGLDATEVGIVVVDRTGRIVARRSGATLDPRVLDPAVQRVIAR